MSEQLTGLALLRAPFPAHQISKLPKPTKAQTDAVKTDFKKGHRCAICGTWHHPDVVHLDYVGHAALTDRLLDADPAWTWEPLSMGEGGLPVMDGMGGMWIRLTVCGVTRLGYGHAGNKEGGDAIKEVIGDALRNAAMRFGAALDLWHKGDLHIDDEDNPPAGKPRKVAGIPDDVRANPKKEAFDALAPDWKTYIIDMAAVIENLFEQSGAQAAAQEIAEAAERDEWLNEHRIALEYKLSSKARTAISAITKVAA